MHFWKVAFEPLPLLTEILTVPLFITELIVSVKTLGITITLSHKVLKPTCRLRPSTHYDTVGMPISLRGLNQDLLS